MNVAMVTAILDKDVQTTVCSVLLSNGRWMRERGCNERCSMWCFTLVRAWWP